MNLVKMLIIVFTFFASADDPKEFSGKVIGVHDGDTITVLDEDKIQHKVRLIGIDAPESHQEFGSASRQHIAQLIIEKPVTVKWKTYDKYGRILGAVYLDDKLINLLMIEDGFAWHYKQYSGAVPFAQAEDDARKAHRGLWSHPNPIAPWDYRHNEADKAKAVAAAKELHDIEAIKQAPMVYQDPKPAPISTPLEAEKAAVSHGGGKVYVHGYYRKNGTYVHPYTRRK